MHDQDQPKTHTTQLSFVISSKCMTKTDQKHTHLD